MDFRLNVMSLIELIAFTRDQHSKLKFAKGFLTQIFRNHF